MKKIAILAVIFALCLSTAAAESVPSKTTGDMTEIVVAGDNLPEENELFLRPVSDTAEGVPEEYKEKVEACQKEIEKMGSSESIEEYFGEIKDENGETVSLKELLGVETLNVYEFCPAVAGGYKEEYGDITATMLFSTPYEKDEKVIVMIGLVTVNEDGTQTVEWHPFEGLGLGAEEGQEESAGRVRVVFSPEIMEAIQNGTALMAIVSD